MLVVFPLRAGGTSLLIEAATPLELADLVSEHGVSVLATAPTAYKQILGAGKVQQLAGLRVAVSAGEHIPNQTWQRLHDEIGLRVIDGIGATEMLAHLPLRRRRRHPRRRHRQAGAGLPRDDPRSRRRGAAARTSRARSP